MTDEEVETTRTGRRSQLPPKEERDKRTKECEQKLLKPLRENQDQWDFEQAVTRSKDLTTEGRISPVKDQGGCGACSVFAAVSTIESCFHRVTDVLPTDLSEQHMMDCAYGFGGRC